MKLSNIMRIYKFRLLNLPKITSLASIKLQTVYVANFSISFESPSTWAELHQKVINSVSAEQSDEFYLLFQYIGSQVLGFIFGLAGAAVLLDNSARDSQFQPRIRESMRRLIMNAHHAESQQTLAMIQENVSHVIYLFFVSRVTAFCLHAFLKFAYFY